MSETPAVYDAASLSAANARELAKCREALAALVRVSPFSLAQDGRYCHFCQRSEWHREEHAPDCPWLRAKALVEGGPR